MNLEFPYVQVGFRKGRGTRDQSANIHWIIEKATEFQMLYWLCQSLWLCGSQRIVVLVPNGNRYVSWLWLFKLLFKSFVLFNFTSICVFSPFLSPYRVGNLYLASNSPLSFQPQFLTQCSSHSKQATSTRQCLWIWSAQEISYLFLVGEGPPGLWRVNFNVLEQHTEGN